MNNDQKKTRHTILLMLALSIVGLADSSYLSALHFRGELPFCNFIKECDVVLSSFYSEIFGIPAALLGVLFYGTLFVLILMYLNKNTNKDKILNYLIRLPVIGFIASLFFLYIQAFTLKAFCEYCVLSAITSTLIFILGLILIKYGRKNVSKSREKGEIDG
jgi:uncharacterized membrane protein